MIKILFFADVVGRGGRQALSKTLVDLKSEHGADMVIVNGENASGGLGLMPKQAQELWGLGADVITSGNHIWDKKEVRSIIDRESSRLLRPDNYPQGNPGKGTTVFRTSEGIEVAVINIIGRVFLNSSLDCPFRAVDRLLAEEPVSACQVRFVDFHAEATSEKVAMAYYLDGRVSAVVGTHTHVQTADERILPGGTASLTDVGMCGYSTGVIGFAVAGIVERFLSGTHGTIDVLREGELMINAVLVEVDEQTGKTQRIERINRKVENS